MIKEAYCSFEVSKLLKENGFNERSSASYDSKGQLQEGYGHWNKTPIWYAAPTHQMAIKWLREVHHLFIGINIEVGDIQILPSYDFEETVLGYSFAIYNEETLVWILKDKTPRSYEEAVEAALKYCLEKIIK